jgi:hypothetical protein
MAAGGLVGAAILGNLPDKDAYALVFELSTVARVAALLFVPFVHVEVLRAIPLISSTLALRINAGSIESPIAGSIGPSPDADDRGERR